MTTDASQRLQEEGLDLLAAGRAAEAVQRFERALALDGGDRATRVLYANALLRSNRLSRARREFERLAQADPADATLRFSLATVLREQGRHAEAIEQYLQCVRLDPSLVDAHAALGATFLAAARPDEAYDAAKFAVGLRADHAVALAVGGDACRDRGFFEDATRWYRRALAAQPDMIEAGLNLAQLLLMLEQYEEGWTLLDRALTPSRLQRIVARWPVPRWKGEPLRGRTLAVWFDQGLGDQVMFASCVDDLLDAGARCVLDCDPRLVALFRRSWPEAVVIASDTAPSTAADFHIPAYALPGLLRQRLQDFPNHAGYLTPDPRVREEARRRLAALGGGTKVGVAWSGGTATTRRDQRSIPMAALAPLRDVPGIRLVSLQRDRPVGEVGTPDDPAAFGMAHWPELNGDPDPQAGLLAELDAVIGVQSTAIHLAGALGKPVSILVSTSPGWPYGARTRHMRWYPKARVLRQAERGDWRAPIEAAAERLAQLSARSTTSGQS